jgi:hypothetical protein
MTTAIREVDNMPIQHAQERGISAPGTLRSLELDQVFAPAIHEQLKREDVRFAAPYDPYANLAEATKTLLRPEVAAAVHSK